MSTNGSASLNGGNIETGLPVQMSDNWLDYIAFEKLLKESTTERVKTGQAILNFGSHNIQKYVVAVDKSNGQINFLKLGSY